MKKAREEGRMKISILNRNLKNKKTSKVEIHPHLHQEQKDKKRLMSL
jgi:hypothetical protein